MLFCAMAAMAFTACGGDDNDSDPVDSDGDGVVDTADAFPNDASESVDSDGDGVGNNSDNCLNDANQDQRDSDADDVGDACELSYAFVDGVGDSTVAYTGQTARHMLIEDLVASMLALSRGDTRTAQQVIDEELNLYYRNREEATDTDNILDGEAIGYTLKDGGDLDGDGTADVTLVTDPTDPSVLTLGSISSGKNLVDKIAGNDRCSHILVDGGASIACADGERGEFFGWELGLDADPLVRTPDDLVQFYFGLLAAEAVADSPSTIATLENDASVIPSPTVNGLGHDFRQLVQKFLLGAVTFSQGTADYLQTNFGAAAALALEGDSNYTAGQHDWDEAFGYYGAARNAAQYTDLEARAREGRDAFKNGYNDTNGDGYISVRSEVMLGNSTNCAKRDVGATVATTLTEDAFDAFVAGRQILQDAGDAGGLSDDQLTALNAEIVTASVTWEKCIAATVVHYINDVLADMERYSEGRFVDLEHYTDLAKHWSEMKGFALGLQFNPNSPFRDAASDATVDDLKTVLWLMGDAPVLADGTQLGNPYPGGSLGYQSSLLFAREILEDAYGFDGDNAKNW